MSNFEKSSTSVQVMGGGFEPHNGDISKFGTSTDQQDMYRLGKEQKLKRNFGFFAIFGFSAILLSTWETQIATIVYGLSNGGTAGILYMYIMSAIGFFFVVCSMAEMSSMAPTAGGQYHWVSEFAPRSIQREVSYIVGWLCVLGWQTGCASSCFLSGSIILGIAMLNNPDFLPTPWQVSLTVIAVVMFCCIFNTLLAQNLPLLEGIVLILHIFGFFAILIPMWILAPRSTSKEVWTGFNNGGGWSSTGTAVLVGMISPVVSLIGSDSAAHMSEEVRDASITIPKAMFTTILLNGTLGFVMLVTMCYNLGNLDVITSSPPAAIGVPFIAILANGVQSVAGGTVMSLIILILSIFCAMTNMAAASRQLFAFARDQAVPFGDFWGSVPAGWEVPIPAIILTGTVSSALSLIAIGSSLAYTNITSLGLAALLSSYIICILCIAWRRIANKPLLPRRFDLGRYGLPVNILALSFLSLVYIFIFFPQFVNPTVKEMNWAVVIYGGVMILAGIYFAIWGRKTYKGPVAYVRKLE